MKSWVKLSEAFAIFAKYTEEGEMEVSLDALYAGPDPRKVSGEDLTRLAELGWYPSDGSLPWFYMFLF